MFCPERRSHITKIQFLFQGYRAREAFELLGECGNLKKLWIGVTWGTTRGSKRPQDNLWLARGAGALRPIRGLNNLDLRVRETHNWGKHLDANLAVHFDTDRKTIQSRAQQLDNSGWIRGTTFGQVWSAHRRRYAWDHVEEFERVLRDEMGKDREPAKGKKGHGIVGLPLLPI